MRACCTNAYVNDVHTEHKHKNKKKAYAYVAAVLTNISINIRLIFMLTLALISLGCHAKSSCNASQRLRRRLGSGFTTRSQSFFKTWFNMAVHHLRWCLRSWPKLRSCFYTLRCNVHTKAAETIEELENVYNERKCFINGKLRVFTCGRSFDEV